VANGDISRLSPRGASVNARSWCKCCGFGSQALFLEVITEETDQHCSTFLLPQWEQTPPPAS
jgi:hypothetical protein